jgi:hypothetical protein
MSPQKASQDLDRELIELLNELRVALPGVQVLFAFLLTVPFSQRFGSLTGLQRGVYFGTVMATALASTFLIAPSAYHRLRWRQHDKEQMLITSNRLSIAGTAFLALSIASAVFLVTDVLFGVGAAALAGGATAGIVTWFWFGLPLVRVARDNRSPPRGRRR